MLRDVKRPVVLTLTMEEILSRFYIYSGLKLIRVSQESRKQIVLAIFVACELR